MDAAISTPEDIIARTLWGEARGEGYSGQQAVANVICNRAALPRWWGHDEKSVCLHPYQFSCWNQDNPNRAKLIVVTDEDPIFGQCLIIASDALKGLLKDLTNGADSYRVIGTPAKWANGLTPVAAIGHHEFFKTI